MADPGVNVAADYPPGSVRALLASDLVSPATRKALEERLAPHPVEQPPRFFNAAEFRTLATASARLLALTDDRLPPPEYFAAQLDARLARGEGDGWRYDALPPDPDAYRQGLRALDAVARARFGTHDFASLENARQDAVLGDVQRGELARWFEDLLTELSEIYTGHPLVQERIGFAGMADTRGWRKIGLDERESWEPAAGQTRYAVPPAAALAPRSAPSPPPMRRYADKEAVDAVVVGTGAGGAPLLARLAQAGLKVVALEAGKHWDAARDFATDERAQNKLFWLDERLAAGGDPLAFGNNNSGCGVGGATLHFTAYTPRPQPDDFHLHGDFGVGCDWPLSYADLEPYYDELETFLGISGPTPYPWGPPRRRGYPLPPLPLNAAAQLMQRACKELGIQTAPAANAALSAPYYQPGIGQRPACTNRGFCQAGCSVGAKGSMDVTFIPLAIGAGAEVRAECFVTTIERDVAGQVNAVVYTQAGKEHRQRCRSVFLCAGAVETPRLLLLNHLANASGQVGRNFLAHPGVQVWARFDGETRPFKGIPGGLISEDTHRPRDADFAGGYLLQSIGVMPVTYASQHARGRGRWGEELAAHLRDYNHVAGINILGEGLPSAGNFLELSDEKDARGLPKPRVHFTAGENERRMAAHAEKIMREIWTRAGGQNLWAFPRFAHTMGTCRMGRDARTAVVDADGRSFEVPGLYISDNSTFPSALSVNPALTLMALALRTADRFLTNARAL